VVEDGDDLLDPFAPWVDRRVADGDVVAACEAAARDAYAPVLARLRELVAPLLAGTGVGADEVTAVFDADDGALVVRLAGPAVPRETAQAIGDRAVQALRAGPRRHRTVDVSYTPR
jgi:hypothetical protein